MFTFVSDIFMVPDDPLGRHGPTLDQLLTAGGTTTAARLLQRGMPRWVHGQRSGAAGVLLMLS